MGFTVVRASGMSDYQFQDYVRIDRYHGIDVGKCSRTHDARMGKRWLPVWADRDKAETFAADLRQETSDQACSSRSLGRR